MVLLLLLDWGLGPPGLTVSYCFTAATAAAAAAAAAASFPAGWALWR